MGKTVTMGSYETNAAMNTLELVPKHRGWSLPLRIAFRFVFSYLMLYLFDPTAETLWHFFRVHFGFTSSLQDFLAAPWAAAVQWAG